jgi:hypothetical protein
MDFIMLQMAKNRMTKFKYNIATLLVALAFGAACDKAPVKNLRSFSAAQNSGDGQTEIISSESVDKTKFLSENEKAVKRYKPISLIGKIIERTTGVKTAEYFYNNDMKKSTGMLSYLGTNGVTTNSRAVDSVSLAWFKTVRAFAGTQCQIFVKRESDKIAPENLLITSKNMPTQEDLNPFVIKTLRLGDIDDSIHPIAKTYAPIFKEIADKITEEPGTDRYVDALRNAYRLYCIAVFTDPFVIYY